MIAEFASTWPLFADAYVAGWILAALLGLCGVLVVARDQVFFGAAIAQASTLGIAIALVVEAMHPFGLQLHGHPVHARAWAVVMSGVASVGIEVVAGRRETREAVTGFVFLASTALAILLVAHSPFGFDEVQRLLSSTLIGASRADAWIFGIALLTIAAVIAARRDTLLLIAIDPVMAEASGLRVRAWSIGIAIVLAVVVGLGIRIAGLLYVFGCLVLPALIAKQVCRTLSAMFIVAPLAAVATAVSGFVLAHGADLPPAHIAIALQAAVLACVWSARAVLRRGPRASALR